MAMSASYTYASRGEIVTKDFVVGQAVEVQAFNAWRRGEVVSLGPKRVTVRYAQNREGTLNERAFRPSQVVAVDNG